MPFALVPKKHFLPPFSLDIAGSGRKNMSTYFRPKFMTNISGRCTRNKLAELATRVVEQARNLHRLLVWGNGKNRD
jgi:hypothetical protein